jgi:hypothetical protein
LPLASSPKLKPGSPAPTLVARLKPPMEDAPEAAAPAQTPPPNQPPDMRPLKAEPMRRQPQ